MLKKVRYSVSIVNRLTLLMLFLGAIALLALSISVRIANDTKGSANMINQLGLLRMKSYQLLSMVPLTSAQSFRLNLFADIPLSSDYTKLLTHYELMADFNQLQMQWENQLIPKIEQASAVEELRPSINDYVVHIDNLVHQIDLKTEQQLVTISRLQLIFMFVIVLFLLIQIYYLRQYLLVPWKGLVNMAESIAQRNFSARFKLRNKKNEFDILGQAFNEMSEQIESQYQLLEERVAEKTAELQHKNSIVSFLYQSTKQLHTSKPLCERFLLVLHQLEGLTPLSQFQMRFYETDDLDRYQEIGYDQQQKLPYCQNQECSACLIPSKPYQLAGKSRYWYLQDNNQKYGLLLAVLPENTTLSQEQEELISGLVEQMTMTIALDRQIERQKQYLLMKERSAMARELHDSIAQSLSCIKIHVSCLQMQGELKSPEGIELLATMRKEINIAYSQLRELITSFHLRLNDTGFYASLQELVKEFEKKLVMTITLNYQLPLNMIGSKHAIHLLQIIREALNNIYKHAQATAVSINLFIDENNAIRVSIEDNGFGIQPAHLTEDHHYGLIIMRDRAELLNGHFVIDSEPNKGTKIMITFKSNHIPFTVIED
ncbi:two-component system nitrate/nitrite sensor histidine kinase NarX [Orbus hercynius]|uniref:Sensor protein n=1 Tax=Orbus hercynius TaxID=593135 RepID=A0A495REN6_9GAMM|nr:nitrate/nitrite two-component system sensor histidine kinase NarX [Orbus hercynius]RKS85780.1 two-component system nitrate/nitrite sensor histidine kinase NarX [Orbus hercynius]